MTNRIHSLTVVLEADRREDDAEAIINAILLIKGVVAVGTNVSDFVSYMAESRARTDLGQKLLDIVYPKTKAVS